MTLSIPELIAAALAIAALVLFARKYLPAGTFTKIETAVSADVAKVEATVRADAVAASSKFESWVTDLSAELGMKAKAAALAAQAQALTIAADASIKAKQDLARAHATKVLAALPPV